MRFRVVCESAPRAMGAARVAAGGKVVRASDYSRWVRAKHVLGEARVQAKVIRDHAREEHVAERERGYQEGLREARAVQVAEIDATLRQARAYLDAIEGEMVDLVMDCVREIIGELDAGERIVRIVRGALGRARRQKQAVLRLHTDDVATVLAWRDDLLAEFPAVEDLDIVATAQMARGACRVETEIGVIEAGVDAQLAALEQALRRSVEPEIVVAAAGQDGGGGHDDET
ncbi:MULTISPECIES: HrpE/YscL family type III secretion apparatus protein [unclassified Achromobacter]|uniref:HrpE/YscL family type III secretion apparatus protein n=1 Tax=unclassified Achromobacter TaxID=2626865 RepID=UPI000B514FF5|nr:MULTISPECIES: HrpE/YscL family type III secretion apparatus protein [unclassified Achromobacter]OWT72717.1 type III secretion system protein [Achromobacter sp. HZ34]OWT73936.1 type III secretion system protein [Achromobacter sp. HZ28]